MLATLGAKARNELRDTLQARSGIEAVFFQEDRGFVWAICGPSTDVEKIRRTILDTIVEADIDPGSVQIRFVFENPGYNPRRVRLLEVVREDQHDGHVRIRTTLELSDQTYVGEASGERSDPIELRTAALAALDAIKKLVDSSLDLRLVGVKQFKAFDADFVVVSIYRAASPPQRYVGTVLQSGGHAEAAVMAVLHALNRLLGNFLDRVE